MAQFIFLYRTADQSQPSPAQMQESMKRWTAWFTSMSEKGAVKDRGQPLDRGGKLVAKSQVHDGPYAEKDLVIGYTIVEAKDASHAAELARGCPLLETGGFVEVRPVMQM